MKYKENWDEAKEKFDIWWKRGNAGRPLMRIAARRNRVIGEPEPEDLPENPQELHLNVEIAVKKLRNYCRLHEFMCESFPSLDLNIGPGSMAVYLGAQPAFAWDTVWYQEIFKDGLKGADSISFDPQNCWWTYHKELLQKAQAIANGDFLVNIPDILENIDIVSALRGPQALCYDLMDEPELVNELVKKVDDLYFKYYDPIYDIVKDKDNSSSYTSFHIWGIGKTAKVQCDFSALISPDQFREFVKPSLQKQCRALNHSLYHLDGPDAIKHLDALMEIEELDALQFTPGAGLPDCGSEKWYPIYDKVRKAGKALWVCIYDGDVGEWVESADKIVKRYGSDGLYLLFPEMGEEDAKALVRKAERDWK